MNQGASPFDPRTNAQLATSYIGDARAYLRAAKTLDSMRDRQSHEAPIYFLLCHAVELLLKAFILAKGGDSKALKRFEIRHKLDELHARAKSLGLVGSDHFSKVVEWLAPFHQTFAFRYSDPAGYTQYPNASDVAVAVEEVMAEVFPQVRSLS
jgi:hypothetical protein